jgi:hypothetical protein
VRPAGYPVPTHGPVGGLLRAQRRSPFRPAHIHFMASKPGFKTLVTQVFADDAEHLDNDVTFSVIQSLVGHFEQHDTLDGAPPGFTAPWCSLTYDLVLTPGESRLPTPPYAEVAMPLDPTPLAGKTAVILGGIGQSAARRFAEACATVLRFSTGSVIQVDGGRHL